MTYSRKILNLLVFILSTCFSTVASAYEWEADWISAAGCENEPNTWLNFQKTVTLGSKPGEAVARIAADSKYWLWINGQEVVFEGGLKRGPNPNDTYYDELDIAPWLTEGENTISVLLCYFGKDGFSHKSSGKAGLLFDCRTDTGEKILSDSTWCGIVNNAYQTCGEPEPNYRLSEANLLYDGREGDREWYLSDYSHIWPKAIAVGKAGAAPWNGLIVRPLPQWKFGQPSEYVEIIEKGDSIIGVLPYNAQITPVISLRSEPGKRIVIGTDNYFHYNGSVDNIRAEYITKEGVQEYESLGWVNGHKVYYVIPEGVEVLGIKYRESGYDCEFSGKFESSDTILNKLWDKSCRTLYVTMRDTYMDCPERERAQWTGDAVNESGEAFYALSLPSHSLARKWLRELADWQRADSAIYAPVPTGNWEVELPGQSLASVGFFGAWNYYKHTGDIATLQHIYPAYRRYMERWNTGPSGFVNIPEDGTWVWGDWGENKDMNLLITGWYYLALKGMAEMASELNLQEDRREYLNRMDEVKKTFDACWTPDGYRSPEYTGETDDRVQALAVVSGIADEGKYGVIMDIFGKELHASPYMEKYVFEAMMQMNQIDKALERHKDRYKEMVTDPRFTTLYEHWDVAQNNFTGGTINHAWSGGGLTVLSQYLCGIEPLLPGYKEIMIAPRPGSTEYAMAEVESVSGKIKSSFRQDENTLNMDISAPTDIPTLIGVPTGNGLKKIIFNGDTIWENGQYSDRTDIRNTEAGTAAHLFFKVNGGEYKIEAIKE